MAQIHDVSDHLGFATDHQPGHEATVRAHVDQAARDDDDRALLLGALFGEVAA